MILPITHARNGPAARQEKPQKRPPADACDVTVLLAEVRDGNQHAADQVFALVYDELRRVAGRYLARERADHTLQPTALVHEAYLKLLGGQPVDWRDRVHFIGLAARAMRQILVNHAVQRRAQKRGGGAKRVALDGVVAAIEDRSIDLIALNEALDRLTAIDPMQAKIVELRFFAGLTVKDTAAALGVSARTVDRESRIARVWLHRAMSEE